MDIKKLLFGTLAGFVSYFLLGWLIYGLILMDMMSELNNPDVMRAEEDMNWATMILSNVCYGFLLTYIFLKWANISSFGAGASAGAIISLLIALTVDLSLYSYSTMITSMTGIVIDVVASIVMGGITGGVIGAVLGMGGSASPAEAAE